MSKEAPHFWGLDGSDRIGHESIGDLLEEYVDDLDNVPSNDDVVTVVGYDRINGPTEKQIARNVIDYIYEWLDEEYSTCADEATNPPTEVVEAAEVFAKIVFNNYIPLDGVQVIKKEVKYSDYVDLEMEWQDII